MTLRIPVLSYENLRGMAKSFLLEHNADGSIPVPIEQIVEFDFGTNIIPIPGLQRVHDVDAFISNDLKSLMVDLGILESRSPNRYRFSLAHELAHAVLHRDVFDRLRFSDIAEWKAQIMGLSEADREWLEWQAYSFAGLILVPGETLKERLHEAVQLAAMQGVVVQDAPDPAKDYICTWLGRQFEVSAQVIEKRLDKDGLWPPTGS